MSDFLGTLKGLGTGRLLTLGAIGLGVIAFFAFLMARLGTPDMALLYSGLATEDSGQIVGKLEQMGVPYELSPDGTTVKAPRADVARLRLAMAQDGLPQGGAIGYEIFDKGDGFGVSTALQDINRVRALEGELARSIRTIAGVEAARVHLVLPKRELFSRDRQAPSASIVLKTAGPGRVQAGQVRAIQHLVAAAVPGLDPTRVSVIDDRGTLLARGGDPESTAASAGTADELRRATEERFSGAIESLLERSLGPGKVRAQVTADMDFDRVSTTAETYDPESQVVRSTQTVEESTSVDEGAAGDTVSVGQNLPGAFDQVGEEQARNTNASARTEETVNYEISRTVTNHVREAGTVRRLSVAVLVDGLYEAGANGAVTYVPREEAELQRIAALVRTAVGFDESRGDRVEVVNMRFAQMDDVFAGDDQSLFDEFNLRSYIRVAETLVLFVIALLVILLVVRPFIARMLAVTKASTQLAQARRALGDEASMRPALEGPQDAANAELEEMMDVKKVEGQVRATSLRRIGDIVERHPEEALSIVRNWMYDKA